MFCRQHRHWAQLATVAAFLLGGSSALAVDGPSFDCSQRMRQTLAVILCTVPEAAQADWDLNTAYWASLLITGTRRYLASWCTNAVRCLVSTRSKSALRDHRAGRTAGCSDCQANCAASH